jgi:hypothetical protein
MDFKLVRLEKDQEQNSERAYIAASRRKDRSFNQGLESLQKASDLHFRGRAGSSKSFHRKSVSPDHSWGHLRENGRFRGISHALIIKYRQVNVPDMAELPRVTHLSTIPTFQVAL